ncbi:endonuclease/exonuclease/phosphatase family protein [Flavobacteriales bacterium]|nr:endonuclease/exonuclease/phosphatase family protein [Flavobacteriales bacterium]
MKGLSLINKLLYLINSICLLLLILSYLSPAISPTLFWPISFFGLLFPVFYVINSLFLIYWIIGFRKQSWPNIIVLLIGIQYIGLFFGSQPTTTKTTDSIKVLSYNVRLFNRYEWLPNPDVKSEIFKFLRKENANILCIQEFYTANEIPNLNYKYRHIGLQNKRSQWHMAIYSSYPQIDKGTVSIKGEHVNNTCIYSDMIINSDTIRIYNVHLASNWFKDSDYSFLKNPKKEKLKEGISGIINRMRNSYKNRANQAKVIKEHMNNSPYSIILCGDFNDTPLSYAYNTISTTLNDAFKESGKGIGQSFVRIPTLRIDYILHNKQFRSYNYMQYKQQLSDHYAVSCELKKVSP